jgi:RNA polymerase sigma factor (TIGR02999 family)
LTSRSPSTVSRLLEESAAGSHRALEDLMPLVYRELRLIARRYLRAERRDHTLQPTALVHEAFLRLVGHERAVWKGRGHFLAVAAQAMRRILVDHARRHRADKRGGGAEVLQVEGLEDLAVAPDVDLVGLDEAMTRLEQLDPRAARVVEQRYFAGSSVEETAEALGVAEITVMRDWKMARAWLQRELSGGAGEKNEPGSADGS